MRAISCCFLSAFILSAQSGRFEENKRTGLASLRDGRFDRAVAKLEEVYETDPNDPVVAEGLAIGYMNCDERKEDPRLDEKAYKILTRQLEKGGRAVFLVQLNLSSTFYGSSTTSICSGPLVISPGKISFQCEKGVVKPEHSFTFSPGEVKDMGERFDKGHGMFFIKSGKRTYNFYPASWDKNHSQMILAFARQYLQ